MKKSYLGAVIEFRFPKWFVYGACIEENPRSGDIFLMFAPKYSGAIRTLDVLYDAPIRHKIKFSVAYARSRKNADILKIAGTIDIARLPSVDRRFRGDMSGISMRPCWQIIDGDQRTVVPYLTRETALLSEDGIPNHNFIADYYENDFYPWSAALLKRGPLNFDADAFEAEMRRRLRA